jgi:acyl dehydratase
MQHDTEAGTRSNTVPAPVQVGYRFSRVHCFDPAQVSAFAHAAGDTNPIHHDPQAAARSRFGKPIASGTHTTALLMGLVASHLSTLAQVVGVKFTTELLRPVFADEQVTLEWEVTGIQPHPRDGHFLDLIGSVKGTKGDCRVRGIGRVLVWT